jgi:hypothetical protein
MWPAERPNLGARWHRNMSNVMPIRRQSGPYDSHSSSSLHEEVRKRLCLVRRGVEGGTCRLVATGGRMMRPKKPMRFAKGQVLTLLTADLEGFFAQLAFGILFHGYPT